jgi:hypothetical protein
MNVTPGFAMWLLQMTNYVDTLKGVDLEFLIDPKEVQERWPNGFRFKSSTVFSTPCEFNMEVITTDGLYPTILMEFNGVVVNLSQWRIIAVPKPLNKKTVSGWAKAFEQELTPVAQMDHGYVRLFNTRIFGSDYDSTPKKPTWEELLSEML